MYNIDMLYQSKQFELTSVCVSGKKQTAGILSFRGCPTRHDITGAVICAIEDGVVTASERCYDIKSRKYRRGRVVEITGADGVRIIYGRLASASVGKGDTVRAGDPIGVQGASGAGKTEYLTLEFFRNGRRLDGCRILEIENSRQREWKAPNGDAPKRLIDANELVKHACEMRGAYGSEMAVPLRYIADAPTIGKEEVKDGTMD